MIYSKVAIDYSKGMVIFDPITNNTYTDKQAKELGPDIKQRLILKPNKIGCKVHTIKELEELMKNENISKYE